MCVFFVKNQQGYVNLLIELSPKLLETSIRYGNNIAVWANKVETRYKEFFNIMSKVQQAHGIQLTNANFTNSMTSLTSTASSSMSTSPMSIQNSTTSLLTAATNSTAMTSGYDTGSTSSTINLNETVPSSAVRNRFYLLI